LYQKFAKIGCEKLIISFKPDNYLFLNNKYMKHVKIGNEALKEVIYTLKNGGLVIAPSDTVYGLLVDAKNQDAVRKLIAFKNRPAGKPISIFTDGIDMIKGIAELTNSQEQLLKNLLPGPYTIALPSKHTVNSLLESERGTIGVRWIKFEFINNLIKSFGGPTTATSANLSGHSSNYSLGFVQDLPQQKKDLIDLVVDGGDLPHNKPSTVMDLSASEVQILREGDLPFTHADSYTSQSPEETYQIGKKILYQALQSRKDKPVVILLQGELGAGKTVLIKGLGAEMGLDNIDSPTYMVYYEYKNKNTEIPFQNLYHFDLYNIQEVDEFAHLGIESMLQVHNLLCIEWGEKIQPVINLLKNQATIIQLEIEYSGPESRNIKVKY
jgi:L-threonylcarbamoyladenylate synthase